MKKLIFLQEIILFEQNIRKGDSFNIISKDENITTIYKEIPCLTEYPTIYGTKYFAIDISSTQLETLLDNNLISIEDVQIEEDELFFAKVKPNAIIPTKREEDAGRDVYTCETETIVIKPCSTRLIDTGVAIACNKVWFPKFFDKGGMGSQGIVVSSGVGDSGFRDGYFISLVNTNKDKWLIITTQTQEEIDKCDCFNSTLNKFCTFKESLSAHKKGEDDYVGINNCIIKPINKAIAQFTMLPVPKFKEKEISWEEIKELKSERMLGKMGSSGK